MFKALIVDEEVDMWFLLSGVLRQNQIKTNFVNNLSAAKKSLEKEVPRVLFLDNRLPDGFGPNFIKFVKAKYPQTKIVMITDNDEPIAGKKAVSQGADSFINKPFSCEIVNATIKRLLTSNAQPVV